MHALPAACGPCAAWRQVKQCPPRPSCFPNLILTFAGEAFSVVRYHSLAVVENTLPSCLEATAWAAGVLPSRTTPQTPSQSPGGVNQQSATQPHGSNVNDSTALQGSPTSHRVANGNHVPVPQENSRSGSGTSCLPQSRTSDLQQSDASTGGDYDHSGAASRSCRDEAGCSGTEALVVMGLEHKERPHVAVQFHPESVATAFGAAVLQNFRDITLRHLGLPCTPPRMPSLRGNSQDFHRVLSPRLHHDPI